MVNKRRGFKGRIVWDEDADSKLEISVRDTGWDVIKIKKSDRGVGLSDEALAIKYGKGMHPVFTSDLKMNKNIRVTEGFTGYVIHKGLTPENLQSISQNIKTFFSTHSASKIRGKRWVIGDKTIKYESIKESD